MLNASMYLNLNLVGTSNAVSVKTFMKKKYLQISFVKNESQTYEDYSPFSKV